MGRLLRILEELETDPAGRTFSTDKHTLHNYIERVYEPLVNLIGDPKVIVEIGVLHGASIAMWKKAFPMARVVGVDLEFNENLHPSFVDMVNRREVEVLFGNAYSEELMNRLPSEIDLFIDDGSHCVHDQLKFLSFRSKLSKDGVIIVEDVEKSWRNIRKFTFETKNGLQGKSIAIPLQITSGRFDDCVFIWTRNSQLIHHYKQALTIIENIWLKHHLCALVLTPFVQIVRFKKIIIRFSRRKRDQKFSV